MTQVISDLKDKVLILAIKSLTKELERESLIPESVATLTKTVETLLNFSV